MAAPNSKTTLKEYIKRKLGAPVLEINVDDDQFDDRIDEALQYFHNYHYDGTVKMYLKLGARYRVKIYSNAFSKP